MRIDHCHVGSVFLLISVRPLIAEGFGAKVQGLYLCSDGVLNMLSLNMLGDAPQNRQGDDAGYQLSLRGPPVRRCSDTRGPK
jgi:hypothetical protein